MIATLFNVALVWGLYKAIFEDWMDLKTSLAVWIACNFPEVLFSRYWASDVPEPAQKVNVYLFYW